ncbi:MAG: pseudouridine synthase [Akkermansiaceae bacterium]|nr:pseudouridine synthase [Akkermansiaceae bacterium]
MSEEPSSEHAVPEGGIRLNKFLASCGYESRRAADRLITEGRVEINGRAGDAPGIRVQPGDFVKVDGHHVEPKEEVMLLMNKPRGFVCSRVSQGTESTVYELIPSRYSYVNYIGRLDTDSEGLVLFTNNGAKAQQLAHPRSGIEKEYWVTLDQNFGNSVLIQMLKGLRLPEGQAKAKYVGRLSPRRACVVLEQGLKRQIRQMFGCMGLRVKKLVRVRIGSLWGGDLEPGNVRVLTPEELALVSKNPPKRRHLVGAEQAFGRQDNPAQSETDTAPGEDGHYTFNPADFESGDDETERDGHTLFEAGEAFEPEKRPHRQSFHGKGGLNERRGDRFQEREHPRRSGRGHSSAPFRDDHFGRDRRSFSRSHEGGEARSPRHGGRFDGYRSFTRERGQEDRTFGASRFNGKPRYRLSHDAEDGRRSDSPRRPERKFGQKRTGDRFDRRRPFENAAPRERSGFGEREPRRYSGQNQFDGRRRLGGNGSRFRDGRSFGSRNPNPPGHYNHDSAGRFGSRFPRNRGTRD